MRNFTITSQYQYEEQQAKEQEAEKTFTLTQKKTLIEEDYYSISRFIAVENVDVNTIPEHDFYVYQFNYMSDGCTLNSVIIDEETAENFIHANTLKLMQGKLSTKDFQEYFE